MSNSFTSAQLKQITEHGLTAEQVDVQLSIFQKGLKPIHLVRPATVPDGMRVLNEAERLQCSALFQSACEGGRFSLFVPASGAASRMFKSLLSVYYRDKKTPGRTVRDLTADDPDDAAVIQFFEHLEKFAFYSGLYDFFRARGEDLIETLNRGEHVPVLEAILVEPALGWSLLPKGLVPFHRYATEVRTAFDEHLCEAAAYCADRDGNVKIHFTVSEAALNQIRQTIEAQKAKLKNRGFSFDVEYSFQQSATDTVAVDLENRLFEETDGKLLFRPGGHGALLQNLNTCGADLVFIKNIDNILPDSKRDIVAKSQKVLGGFLVQMENIIHGFLKSFDGGGSLEDLEKAENFMREAFGETADRSAQKDVRVRKAADFLNRPIRVCGMVRNQGEPGGGPFWVQDPEGHVSKQIVEKSQVNMQSAEQAGVLANATHFNPVNLVCSVKNFKGEAFDLNQFVDARTAFISLKSKDGRDLKALELPGLWNGAMAGWLTFFVEVPIETFAPVKELNDLLRDEHQR